MNDLFQFLERVGIPAGFAYVLLFRIEPELKKLTAAVLQLPERIHLLAGCQAEQPEKHEPKL
jgi:hypothetical protein